MGKLDKIPIAWPLTGGLSTKQSPLIVQPGSFLTLDNVRQERQHEWRARNGYTGISSLTPVPALITGDPGGLVVGVARTAVGDRSSVVRYFGTGTTWLLDLERISQRTAVDWQRFPIRGETDQPDMVGYAYGSVHFMVAHHVPGMVSSNIYIGNIFTGKPYITGAGINATRPRCAYASDANRLVAVGVNSSNNLIAQPFIDSTGAQDGSAITLLSGTAHATQPYVDIMYYGGATVTVVCRTSGNQIAFIEFNPQTKAIATSVTLAVNADNCVSLLSDPDSSGTRFVAVSNAAPSTRVLRVDSSGTILTNSEAEAIASTQIAGVAYESGAGWMVAYQTTNQTKAAKRSSGVVSAVSVDWGTSGEFALNSQAWREPGDDVMRVLAGIHISSADEPQDTYVEMAISFSSQGLSVAEPQARILPFDSGPAPTINASLTQVQRQSTDVFSTAMMRLSRFTIAGGTRSNAYTTDRWVIKYLGDNNQSGVNHGNGVVLQNGPFFPLGQLTHYQSASAINGSDRQITSHGTYFAPKAPVITGQATGGGLTLLGEYNYRAVLVLSDSNGNIWRSKPSQLASVTLTGSNNRITGTLRLPSVPWATEVRSGRLELYRTKANGSLFQKVAETSTLTGTLSWTDDISDSDLGESEFLYSTGELESAITPRASHIAANNDRYWIVNADFRTELWFTKHIRPGRQPEWCEEFVVDLDDEFGDITGIVQIDGALVVFKRNAIYFVTGDGPEDSGAGALHSVNRISSDVGALPGNPTVSTGQDVFFVSERGIYRVDRSGQIDFVGAPVDQYLSMPLVQTQETVYDGAFITAKNEIRFVTTNYILSYDRTFGIWYRDTLSGGRRCVVAGGRFYVFTSARGYVEGDHTVTQDNGVSFTPVIRSPWIRPANPEGWIRLYMLRLLATRTTGGGNITPVLKVYYDNNDTLFDQVDPVSPIAGATTLIRAELRGPRIGKITAFSPEITFPGNDVTFRLEGFSAEIGMRKGAQKLPPSTGRWTT